MMIPFLLGASSIYLQSDPVHPVFPAGTATVIVAGNPDGLCKSLPLNFAEVLQYLEKHAEGKIIQELSKGVYVILDPERTAVSAI